jgi:superfamily II DNA or RNA helicase/Holliday junction resolvase
VGPWQAFERDVARLLLANGFEDVRLVGGSGDSGGDVLGVRAGELWVVQVKLTTNSPPSREAVSEVVEAARFYGAQRMVVATSRPPGDSFLREKARYERMGLAIEVADPGVLLRLMADTPEYPPARRELRDYQSEASIRLREALLDVGRGQIVMATGLGKTVVMADVVADLLGDSRVEASRVLVVAHTIDLVSQLHRSFWYQLPKWVPTHQLADTESPSFSEGITFATIQSVNSRLESLPRFGLVLIDEAHHVGADVFQRCIAGLDPPMLGGVTATPWRGDAYDIDQTLGPPLVRFGIADGLQRGWLSDVDYRLLADNINWEAVQEASHYGYSLGQLNQKLIIPTRDEEAARIIRETWNSERRRAAVVFCRSIGHAKLFAAMLRQLDMRAEPVSSEVATRERDKLMTRFRAGQLDALTTVDLFNEGVDLPDVDMVVFMRVTHSRRVFVQQLGRGLRLSPGKDKVVVLDFVTDLRRVAEVIELDRASGWTLERLSPPGGPIQFDDVSAGDFMREWMLDQASLLLREGDPKLDLPSFNFPAPSSPGGVQ